MLIDLNTSVRVNEKPTGQTRKISIMEDPESDSIMMILRNPKSEDEPTFLSVKATPRGWKILVGSNTDERCFLVNAPDGNGLVLDVRSAYEHPLIEDDVPAAYAEAPGSLN